MSRKLILPALGLVLAGATVWQLRHREAVAGTPPTPAGPVAERVHAEARVATARGAQVVVGTERGGRLVRLVVDETATVKKGDLIAELDADEDNAAIAEARARVAQTEADLRFAESQLVRAQRLHDDAVTAADTVERAVHDRDVAVAQRDLAKATVRRLGVNLARTKIYAPLDGVILVAHAREGEIVLPGAPVATVVDLSRVRLEAEIDEFDVNRVHVGDEVRISAEGVSGSFRGRVEEIPSAVSRRGLRPQDPGHPTDSAVLMVRIVPLEPTPLKLGQRAEVDITAGAPAVAVR